MQSLYTPTQFEEAKSRDKLPLKCCCCEQTFLRAKNKIQAVLAGDETQTLEFCSRKCIHAAKAKKLKIVSCQECGAEVLRRPHQLAQHQKRGLKFHFCSQRCSGLYKAAHRETGTRRSKLEVWLEEQLTSLYPNLVIDYNKTSAIGSELDIFIPSLKLAFELNGIFHYEPIFGQDKLDNVRKKDQSKFADCRSHGIGLCIIDTSHATHHSPKKSQPFLDIITKIIAENGEPCRIRTDVMFRPERKAIPD